MFISAIVRTPCQNMVYGLSAPNAGTPDYQLALKQHQQYILALEKCGVYVTILKPEETFPDSVFVEDTAVLTPNCAIITNPGAESRNAEIHSVETALNRFYDRIEHITPPGTIDGGDVMKVDSHFYIGLSQRTNHFGAKQFIKIVENYGFTGSVIPLKTVLHLKTGVSYLENNILLAAGEFLNRPEFENFEIIPVPEEECYAANSLWINDMVLVPSGFPHTQTAINAAGYETMTIDVSEFKKLDGGLSCLSLRF